MGKGPFRSNLWMTSVRDERDAEMAGGGGGSEDM